MYADSQRKGLNPGALALALGGSAVFLFGLSLTAPNFVKVEDIGLKIRQIPLDPPPPPKPETKRKVEIKRVPQPAPHDDHVEVTKPPVAGPIGGFTETRVDITDPGGDAVGLGGGKSVEVTPVHVPMLTEPSIDARYAGMFQPDYPVGERNAEHEGKVMVRVLIGIDGRVKQVEQVGAAIPAFFDATRRRAIAQWRFRPATRDGQPIEAWRTMTVRFQLDIE